MNLKDWALKKETEPAIYWWKRTWPIYWWQFETGINTHKFLEPTEPGHAMMVNAPREVLFCLAKRAYEAGAEIDEKMEGWISAVANTPQPFAELMVVPLEGASLKLCVPEGVELVKQEEPVAHADVVPEQDDIEWKMKEQMA